MTPSLPSLKRYGASQKYFLLSEIIFETNWISTNGNPTLSTSVVVLGGLPRANPVSAMPKSIQKGKTE
jgi:hypothetical protein